jgi:MFS family permease
MHEDPQSVTPAPPGTAHPESSVPGPEETLGGMYVGPPVIRRALLHSFRDGLFCNGMIALNETFAIAAAVSLHASAMSIAMMSSLPLLFGSLAQFVLPAWADPAKGRKHYVLLGVRLQIVFLFLAAFAGWLPAPSNAWAYVAAFVMAAVSANATGPFWVAWMGDLIPSSVRGRHFAWRSVHFAWIYLACSLIAGVIARHYTSHTASWGLFAAIFFIAFLFRVGSFQFMARQYEPVSSSAHETSSLFRFRPPRDFLTYCLATATFQGAAAMSGPFFSVWYLGDLHFDFFSLSMCLSCSVLGSITFVGFWGRFADNFGTSRLLWISGLMVSFIPIPYLFFHHPWAVWLFCFYSGSCWAGYNLATFNHVLNATDQRHRGHYIAFASLITGLVISAFSLAGGFLATRIPVVFTWRLQSLFLLSSLLRLTVFLFFFGKFREYQEALPRRSREVYMELPGYRMGVGLFRNVFRAFRNE